MSAFEIAVLEQLKSLNVAVSRLDGRMDALETRMGGLEARMGGLEARMGGLEARVLSLEESVSALAIETRANTAGLAALTAKVNSFPDMHYLMAAAKVQLDHVKDFRGWKAEQRVKNDEIYHSMATSSEITTLRHEVDDFRSEMTDTDVRLRSIEVRLGIQPPP